MLCFTAVIVVRLLHVQWLSRERFTDKAFRQQVSEETVPARPGDLLDRQGRLLATTIAVPSLYVDPSRVTDPDDVSLRLAAVLNLEADELAQRLRANAGRKFLWIKRQLSDNEAAAVRTLKLPAAWGGLKQEFKRHYPQGELAAHVLGLRNIDGHGRGGAEQAFQQMLRGEDGIRRFVRDARGYVIDILEEMTVPPRDGTNVVLTIDTVLQLHVERELDRLVAEFQPRGACAIVMDPRLGDILAMASRPAYDPNRPEAADAGAWRNLAISAVYEPGSTIKPLIVAWGLEQGVIRRDDVFDCEWGTYRMGSRTLHDHHRYGRLSVNDILVKSSNIGMAKIGQRLGNNAIYEAVTAFGLGRGTGCELPGELPGLVRPSQEWTAYSTGSVPMGHELAATPLQMIAAHAVLANGGRRVSPHLLMMTSDRSPQTKQVVVSQVVSRETAEWMVREPMAQVVQRGTGRQARLDGVTVFGKTGTAQKTDPVTGGYAADRHVSSFVCGAPAEDPQILVLVVVDEPQGEQYGGSVAAPSAARILQHGLRIAQR